MFEFDVRIRSSLPLGKSDVRCLGRVLDSGSLERRPFGALQFQLWTFAYVAEALVTVFATVCVWTLGMPKTHVKEDASDESCFSCAELTTRGQADLGCCAVFLESR